MAPAIIAFDLYGTLLSTASIAEELGRLFGNEKAKDIATRARTYQLEYTWRANSMGIYTSFGNLTRSSFRQAATEAGVELTAEDEQRIMDAYNGLDTFPEVAEGLGILGTTPSLDPYIFSNGTAEMVTSSLKSSSSLAKAAAGTTLSASKVISVDPLGVYKPDPRTYRHLVETTGAKRPGDVWLVSSNPFDALGAVAAGLKSAWVDRGGLGWIDGLGNALDMRPTVVVNGVDKAVRAIATAATE